MESEKNEKPLEYQVLSLAFRSVGAIEYFSLNLPPEAVAASGNHGLTQFYEAILHFYDKTRLEIVDPIAFKSWLLTESDIYEALGGPAVVDVFLETVLSIELSSPEQVTAVLKYRFNKRRQLESLQELQSIIAKKGSTSVDDNGRISFLTDQIRSLEQELGYDPLDRVTTADQIAIDADTLFDLPDFLPTQFPSLNKALGYTEEAGFCKGSVSAVLAGSGKGKSTLAKCFMNYWCDLGYRGIFINFEEAKPHWERVLFTQVTKQNIYLSNKLTDSHKEDLLEIFRSKMAEWGNRFMVQHDPETPYFEDLEMWLRDINGHEEKPLDFVIIDTIQSLFLKGGGGKPRWGQYEEMMVRLEKLAKDMQCAIIITAQENSNRMKEGREVVIQSDAGGSLTIVQKCAVTIFITQHNLGSAESEDSTVMDLQIPKNRITGESFHNDPPMVRYDDTAKAFVPYEPAPPQEPIEKTLADLLRTT